MRSAFATEEFPRPLALDPREAAAVEAASVVQFGAIVFGDRALYITDGPVTTTAQEVDAARASMAEEMGADIGLRYLRDHAVLATNPPREPLPFDVMHDVGRAVLSTLGVIDEEKGRGMAVGTWSPDSQT